MPQSILIIVCTLGLTGGSLLHLATFFGVVPPPGWEFLGVFLHLGAIAVVLGFVGLSRLGKDKEILQKLLSFRELSKTPASWLVLSALPLYAVVNFFLHAGAGHFEKKRGVYAETMRGRILRSFPNKRSFEAARRKAKLHTTRAFSGHWLAFYGSILFLLLLARRRREELAAALEGEQQRAQEELRESLEEGRFHAPPEEIPAWFERLKAYPPARTLFYVMTAQIVVIGGLGLFFQIPASGLLFLTCFLSFALGVNLWMYRSWVREHLKTVRFTPRRCYIAYLDGDESKELSLSYEELEWSFDEKPVQGGALAFLKLYSDGRCVLKQLSQEGGYWSRSRCLALLETWREHT